MIIVTTDKTVGEIVSDDYRTAGVFRQFGLDFCCGGGRRLADACERKGIDVEELLQQLNSLGSGRSQTHNYKHWSPAFLVDYIVNNHHHYIRTKLPEIKAYARKVVKVHGKSYAGLDEMLEVFVALKDELLSHLDKEEQVLFPYIKKLSARMADGKSAEREQLFEAPEAAIAMLREEHDEAGALMARLEELSNGFTPPREACTTYRVYFQNLRAFRDDLHKHIHLENNILFPKALKMLNGERASL